MTHRDLLGSLAASLESEAKGYEQHANGPYAESAAIAREQKVAVLALADEVDAIREDKARLRAALTVARSIIHNSLPGYMARANAEEIDEIDLTLEATK